MTKYGRQKAPLIPCRASKFHGFFPADETCPDCGPSSFVVPSRCVAPALCSACRGADAEPGEMLCGLCIVLGATLPPSGLVTISCSCGLAHTQMSPGHVSGTCPCGQLVVFLPGAATLPPSGPPSITRMCCFCNLPFLTPDPFANACKGCVP